MYIAFRWLLALSSTMWITMCCLDLYFKSLDIKPSRDLSLLLLPSYTLKAKQRECKAKTFISLNHKEYNDNGYFYHFIIFFTCSIMVIKLRNNHNILMFVGKLYNLNFNAKRYFLKVERHLQLKKFIKSILLAISKYSANIWRTMYDTFIKRLDFYVKRHMINGSSTIKNNLMILTRFKELNEERKHLGKLLLTTIRENKNIRMRYQLENLAKNRLSRYIEDTDKLMKKNRCQYVNFQQLYLATHHENVFLQTRLNKLTKERDEAQRNLIELINEVCKSKNNDLKTFCCKFIVETKDNLLNSDVHCEINKFRMNSSSSKAIAPEESDGQNPTKYDKNSLAFINGCVILSQAPKIRGLPGEYVWTIKDKDGLIEKLYEYNFHTDYDNGDIIRRIRQYSVYCDKDCLLDYKSSSTRLNEYEPQNSEAHMGDKTRNISYPITNQKFLTGSEAFQKFLKCATYATPCRIPVRLNTN